MDDRKVLPPIAVICLIIGSSIVFTNDIIKFLTQFTVSFSDTAYLFLNRLNINNQNCYFSGIEVSFGCS